MLVLVPTASAAGGCGQQQAIDPLGVLGDYSVDAGLLQLAALLPSIGGDAHCYSAIEQRTPGVTLVDQWAEEARRIKARIPHDHMHQFTHPSFHPPSIFSL